MKNNNLEGNISVSEEKLKKWEKYEQNFSSLNESRTQFLNKSIENESVTTSPLKSNKS